MVSWSEIIRLQSVLIEGGFDAFAEARCRPYYAARMGAPSVPPGRYFRMHLVGYFEGIDSERGLEWRCSDSLSLRAFLRLSRDRVPDHSWLSSDDRPTRRCEWRYREMLDPGPGQRRRDSREPGASGGSARARSFPTRIGFHMSTRWIWTPARWWRPSCTRPIDTTTLSKTLAKKTSRRRSPHESFCGDAGCWHGPIGSTREWTL